MSRFFSPFAGGRRLTIRASEWRGFAGRIAAALATPLPAVLAMPWDEMIRWVPVAMEIAAESRLVRLVR